MSATPYHVEKLVQDQGLDFVWEGQPIGRLTLGNIKGGITQWWR